MERERSENADLKVRIHRVETEFNSYVSSERVRLGADSVCLSLSLSLTHRL